ncbi:MAG: hypothetical protein ACFFDC_21320 [Promethearchaeota archaeon]
MGIDSNLLKDLRIWCINYANSFLQKKACTDCLEVHSIALIAGWARCYFDDADNISNHKDIDVDIYFAPRDEISGNFRKKINTQSIPTIQYFNEMKVDLARIVLIKPKSNNIHEDIRGYARNRKTKRWLRKLGKPFVIIYPILMPIKAL